MAGFVLLETWANRIGPLKTYHNWPRISRAIYRIGTLILLWLAVVVLAGHFGAGSIILAVFAIFIWIILAFSPIGELHR